MRWLGRKCTRCLRGRSRANHEHHHPAGDNTDRQHSYYTRQSADQLASGAPNDATRYTANNSARFAAGSPTDQAAYNSTGCAAGNSTGYTHTQKRQARCSL
jgi:hypothetical protein